MIQVNWILLHSLGLWNIKKGALHYIYCWYCGGKECPSWLCLEFLPNFTNTRFLVEFCSNDCTIINTAKHLSWLNTEMWQVHWSSQMAPHWPQKYPPRNKKQGNSMTSIPQWPSIIQSIIEYYWDWTSLFHWLNSSCPSDNQKSWHSSL